LSGDEASWFQESWFSWLHLPFQSGVFKRPDLLSKLYSLFLQAITGKYCRSGIPKDSERSIFSISDAAPVAEALDFIYWHMSGEGLK